MGYKNALEKVKASLKANRRVLNLDRRADFKMAQASIDAITNNLLTTQAGLGRSLSIDQARLLQKMERLAGKGSKTDRAVSRAETRTRNLFGSALGGLIEQQMAPAHAVARGTATQSRAALGAGRLLARGAEQAVDIQQAATQEAKAGAEYALSQALRYRAKNDAQLIAEQRARLAEMRLAFQQEKALARFKARLEEKAAGGPGGERLIGARETILQMAQQPGMGQETVLNTARALETTYNLAPGSLTSYVNTLYDESGKSLVQLPLVDEQGNVIQTEMDDDDRLALKQQAVAWLKNHPNTPDPARSRENFLNSIVRRNEEGQYVLADGTPVHPTLAQQYREYAAKVWDEAAPSFYQTTDIINKAEERAKSDVLFGRVSNAAAWLLDLEKGDAKDFFDLETIIAVGSFFIPGTGIGAKIGSTGLRVGASVASRVGAKTTSETLTKLAEKLAARAAARAAAKTATTAAAGAAAKTAAEAATSGAARPALTAGTARLALPAPGAARFAGRAAAGGLEDLATRVATRAGGATAEDLAALNARIAGRAAAEEAAALREAALAELSALGRGSTPALEELAALNARVGVPSSVREAALAELSALSRTAPSTLDLAALNARIASGASAAETAALRETALAELSALGRGSALTLEDLAALNARFGAGAAEKVLAMSGEEVAARTAEAVVRTAAAEGVTEAEEDILKQLMSSLLDPEKAEAWKELLTLLAGRPLS